MSNLPLIQARGLTKKFGAFLAVDHIDFDVHEGEIVGFLGPNGAGKTTTIRMLLNLLRPSEGQLTLFGTTYDQDRLKILTQMNSTSGTTTLPGKLSVEEILVVFADLYAIESPENRVKTVMGQFDLEGLRHRQVFGLSTGQQVRVALAKAFLNKPRILLMDEPTASLDPDIGSRMRDYLKEVVRKEKTTVFVTSHNMREVEEICSRVLFINRGKIQAEGTPRDLAKETHKTKVSILTGTNEKIEKECDPEEIGPYIKDLVQKNVVFKNISIQEPTLEDFFVHLARRQTHE